MSASGAAATELIDERLHWVSAQMGTSPAAAQRYLSEDAFTALAHAMAFSVAEQTPGADVMHAPRTAAIPLLLLARALAGLAETTLVRLPERADADHLRTTVPQFAYAVSAIAQVAANQSATVIESQPVLMLPAGLGLRS